MTAAQGSGHSTKPTRVQQTFGQCSQARGVSWDSPVQDWE